MNGREVLQKSKMRASAFLNGHATRWCVHLTTNLMPPKIGSMMLTDEETELMGLIADLDYEASIADPILQQLSRKGLVLITSGKRVLITEAGIDWLDDHGWSIR